MGGPLLAGLLLAVSAAPAAAAPPAAQVQARGETPPVGTANDDAADDPAIWRDPRRPERSLVVGTDKKAGLHLYALDGTALQFLPAGRLNNVDLVDMGGAGVIVVASDRNDAARARLQLYRLDTRARRLLPLGSVEGGAGEAYGVCLWRTGRTLAAFSVLKDGTVEQVEITLGGGAPEGRTVRRLKLATQSEGCVVDPRTRTLYVGEEARGVWAFDARARGPAEGRLVAPADGAQLVPDVEGLAILPKGSRGGWLVVSSQGDNAYALYALPSLRPAGRFRIAAGRFGSTEETDGIAVAPGGFGRDYPGGLFVAQDGDNAPAAQNFKFVAWRDVVRAVAAQERQKR